MKFSIESRPASQWSADMLVIPFLDKKLFPSPFIDSVDTAMGGALSRLLDKEAFKGEVAETRLFSTQPPFKFDRVLVMGLGSSDQLSLEVIRKIAAKSAQSAEACKARSLLSLLPLPFHKKFSPEESGQAFSEGVMLGLYRFEKYKSKKEEPASLREIHYVCPDPKTVKEFRSALHAGEVVAREVNYARDLINTPARDKPPEYLGREAKKISGLRTRVFHQRELRAMGMEALCGVGQGSAHPPVLVEMHYKPAGKIRKKIALVGKGIVFDSGGLSLKPPKSMETMKDDMSGAATVMAVMRLLPQLRLPVEVYGYVAAAENMPDGAAQRPGDVVRAYNGKTIEVLNTDAEGRLALADALSYVVKHRQVDCIFDIATLTGAALIALGDLYTAALGNDSELIAKLKAAGEICGEKIWELPLAEEYVEEIKSPIADMQNVGGPYGGTINGALFLKNFVDEKTSWVHLDIAGPSWANKPWAYAPKGGTGILVRTLIRLFSEF